MWMRTRLMLAALGCLAIMVGSAALAGRQAAPQLPPGLFFAPNVYQLQPAMDVVLTLTEDQKRPLLAAYKQTLAAPALVELCQKAGGARGNPDNPELAAAAEKLKTEEGKAREEMARRAGAILNDTQKATIRKVNEAVANAIPAALTPEQKEALAAVRTRR
jgi:hypothetical protein